MSEFQNATRAWNHDQVEYHNEQKKYWSHERKDMPAESKSVEKRIHERVKAIEAENAYI